MNPKSTFSILLFWLLAYTTVVSAPLGSEHIVIDSTLPEQNSYTAMKQDTTLWLNLNRWTSGEQLGISSSSKIHSRSEDSDGITLLSIVIGLAGIIAVRMLKPENPRHIRFTSKKNKTILIL